MVLVPWIESSCSSGLMDLLQVQPKGYSIDFTARTEQGKKGKKGGMGCC